MSKCHLSAFIVGLLLVVSAFGEFDKEIELPDEDVTPSIKDVYVAPTFQAPTIVREDVYFVEWFDNLKGIGRAWHKSIAKKEGAKESLAKYNGEWFIGAPSKVAINNDFGLIVKTKARHHAIASSLNRPFKFEGKPFVAQYEVKYEQGQECGGGYVKLLSVNSKKVQVFHDKTPYTIMFGPDKCGVTSKVHFIIRLKNPKNGSISEHHAKQSTKTLSSYFDDEKTHLYTLIVNPDNSFSVKVDHEEITSGNLLKDLEPSVVPPQQIADPNDKKPEDWDDREFIVDPEATKPEDWDENAPKEVIDEDAVKPSDWIEDEEPYIGDSEAKKPEDWDYSMDGEWEPKKVENPKCAGLSGCGKWVRPKKANPLYKGKWTPPRIANPAFKGRWSPRLIENPHYFEADPYKQLAPISAVGFELWTMSSDIIFDNIIVADDLNLAREFARQTFDIKSAQEKIFDQFNNPQQGIWASILETTEEKPWLWAVFVLALLIPVIFISVLCFGKKSPTDTSHAKKTDEVQPDDQFLDENEEEAEAEDQEGNLEACEDSAASEKVDNKSFPEEDSSSQKSEAPKHEEEPLPSPSSRRTRVRRQD